MNHAELMDLIPLYAFGVLDAQERSLVESHLAAGCDECETLLRDARGVGDALLETVAPVAPSARAKTALLERLRAAPADRDAAPRRTRKRWLALPLAASLATAALLGLYARSLRTAADAERGRNAALEATLAEVRAELDVARRDRADDRSAVARLEALVRDLTAPETRAVALAGQEGAPDARARAFLNPGKGQILFFVYDLPPTPADRTYQLWVIVGGKPVNAGTFQIDEQGHARHEAFTTPDIQGPVTVAVSIEPAGGVPQPTGPIVLMGF